MATRHRTQVSRGNDGERPYKLAFERLSTLSARSGSSSNRQIRTMRDYSLIPFFLGYLFEIFMRGGGGVEIDSSIKIPSNSCLERVWSINLFAFIRAPYTVTVSAIAFLFLAIDFANYSLGRALMTQKNCWISLLADRHCNQFKTLWGIETHRLQP